MDFEQLLSAFQGKTCVMSVEAFPDGHYGNIRIVAGNQAHCDDMLQTIHYLAGLDPAPDGVKLQMLNILKGTLLAQQYEEHPFPLLSMEEYTDLVAESIRLLPEEMILHRMTGDGPGNLLVAPDWVRNKKKVLNTIRRKIAKG